MRRVKEFLFNNSAALVVLLAFVAQQFGWITAEEAEKYKQPLPEKVAAASEALLAPATAPALSPQEIAELIRQAIEEAIKRREKPSPSPAPAPSPTPGPEPTPAPSPVPPEPRPSPVEPMRIMLCGEDGEELAETEVESGQLFRVSAVGAGDAVGWHPVESGDVRMVASTDGKEFAGYLTAGQWVEFSLTDFASKSQTSLRVTCLTAPNPPPVPPGPEPGPEPDRKGSHVRLFVVHNAQRITPDTAIVLNATEVWDSFTEAGNDWKFIEFDSDDPDEKKIVADGKETALPRLLIYDKSSGRLLTSEPLPKSVIALEALVAKYTEGK